MKPLFLFLLCLPLAAETPVQHLLEQKLYERVRQIDSALPGVLGVATIDLTSGRIFVYNGDAVFPTASSIKVPILIEAFRQKLDLNRPISLTPASAAGGSGVLQQRLRQGPVTLTLSELLRHMIESSDNTATNAVIEMVGMDRVNAGLAGQGFRATRLRRIMMDTGAAARGDENTSTPLEMARLFEQIYRGRMSGSSQMVALLKLVKAGMRKAVPDGIETASKPGELTGVRCEAGIVYLPNRPFIVSVYSTFLDAGADPVEAVTRAVFEYFDKLSLSNDYGNRVR